MSRRVKLWSLQSLHSILYLAAAPMPITSPPAWHCIQSLLSSLWWWRSVTNTSLARDEMTNIINDNYNHFPRHLRWDSSLAQRNLLLIRLHWHSFVVLSDELYAYHCSNCFAVTGPCCCCCTSTQFIFATFVCFSFWGMRICTQNKSSDKTKIQTSPSVSFISLQKREVESSSFNIWTPHLTFKYIE